MIKTKQPIKSINIKKRRRKNGRATSCRPVEKRRQEMDGDGTARLSGTARSARVVRQILPLHR